MEAVIATASLRSGKKSRGNTHLLDCFVASLLALTNRNYQPQHSAVRATAR